MTEDQLDKLKEKIKNLTREEMDIIWPAICDWQSEERNSNHTLKIKPFELINKCDPNQILIALKSEYPQTIALALYFLDKERSSFVLNNLSNELKVDVLSRLATITDVDPEIVREMERILEKSLSESSSVIQEDPFNKASYLFNVIFDKSLIEDLEDSDPRLAEELKARSFAFEDIVFLDDISIQKAMREIDDLEISKAIKGVDIELQDKFFRNMSKRAASMLKEDMDFMGPVRLSDAQEAQLKIVSVIRHLEECGEIIIAKGKDNVFLNDKTTYSTSTSTSDKDEELDLIAVTPLNIDYKNIIPNEIVKKSLEKDYKMLEIINNTMHKKLITVVDNIYIKNLINRFIKEDFKYSKLLIEGFYISLKTRKETKKKNLQEIFSFIEELEKELLKD